MNRFRQSLLNKDEFTVSLELVAGRGSFEKAQEKVLSTAEEMSKRQVISAVSITDSPGGRPGIDPAFMALELKKMGIEPIVHYTLKDKNRLNIESEFYGYHRNNLNNLLIMTGDFPKKGYISGAGKPVFDIDPVQCLQLISAMNDGLSLKKGKLLPTEFFAGCVVTPFKNLESEVYTEYIKLVKKISAGSGFIVSQIGYDMRKFHELRLFVNEKAPDIPLIGNLFILNRNLADMIYHHRFTGCTIPSLLYKKCMEGETDKDYLDFSARMFGIIKGMGFDGIHISGNSHSVDELNEIICRGNEYALHWEDHLSFFHGFDDGQFYYYQRNSENGLNISQKNELSEECTTDVSWGYRFRRSIHRKIYVKNGILSKAARSFAVKAAKGKKARAFERGIRASVYGCRDCGDCALDYTALICPMSMCPKQQRNGPCGGSRDGWCELYPGKRRCIYVTIYHRYKAENCIEKMYKILPATNWSLCGTSELNNYFFKVKE